uniref:Uncharacterized protein n=1 Tax=Trichogramma kaykai TaxID=54128 RepID=A0ABD2XMX9_9HYME
MISEEDARLWSSWMLKVADKSLNEWQSWLDSHIDLATRMNNSLIRARNPAELEEADDPLKRIETSEICAADNETKNLESDNNAINEVQKSEEEQRSAVDTKSATSIGIVPTATTTCRKRRAATNRCCGGLPEEAEGKSEKKDNLVNGKTEKTPKIIPLPRDEFEMLKIVDDFKRRAKLYKLLYNHWITTANRVIEEIVEKSAGQQQQQQQAVPQEEIPYFFYLRDEVENDDSGVGIDSCPDSDDDEDGKCCIGQERITWRNTHLFFNLMDE